MRAGVNMPHLSLIGQPNDGRDARGAGCTLLTQRTSGERRDGDENTAQGKVKWKVMGGEAGKQRKVGEGGVMIGEGRQEMKRRVQKGRDSEDKTRDGKERQCVKEDENSCTKMKEKLT